MVIPPEYPFIGCWFNPWQSILSLRLLASHHSCLFLVLTEIFIFLCDGVRFLLVKKCCKGVWVKCIDWTLVNGETSSQGEHQLADNVALFPESPHPQPDFHCIK